MFLGRRHDRWALRWVLLWCGVTLVCALVIGGDKWLPSNRATKPEIVLRSATPVEPRADPAVNTLVYPANRAGHVIIDAVVNGAPMRMLLDTGASFVTLTPGDARAAGITPGELVFNRRASTANGYVRMAIVTLREICLGQLSLNDVRAAVLENLNVSLLGMSFLDRLQSYEMRDGKLTITW
jgi:aspartyl protease family protein